MNLLFSIYQRLIHFWKAKGANGIHSPFVFEFYNEVLNHPYNFYAFNEVESEREKLLNSNIYIEYQDLGVKKTPVKTSIKKLAAKSLMPLEKDVFLFQLCHWLKPEIVIELGTCLGITTAYLSKAYISKIYTFEGIKPIADQANLIWKSLGINNIKLALGPIEATLPEFISNQKSQVNLAVIDANHSYEATVEYYGLLLPKMEENGCIVFDDIYWSSAMARAWNEIRAREEVTVSIDLFHLGLVFFRKASRKSHHYIHW